MKDRSLSRNILLLMLAIYIIAALQFLIKETQDLTKLSTLSYGEKLNFLDKQYYRNYFYKYYAWLNGLIPENVWFSILKTPKTDQGLYQRYAHKFDYYFYPRYVLYRGVETYVAQTLGQWPKNGSIIYPDAVFVMNTKDAELRSTDKIKYVMLNGRKYYLVAGIDDKGLLLERTFIKRTVLKEKEWAGVARAFKELYGVDMNRAGL